jgi:hypothetical protein
MFSMRKPLCCLIVAAAAATSLPSLAAAQHHHDKTADSVVAVAKQAMGTLRHPDSLRRASWNALGFGGGVKDLSPFQGQHWIHGPRFAANQPVDLSQPNFLMYLALADSLIPVGVAYTLRIPADARVPDSLVGKPAEWHTHVFCRAIPGEGTVLADGIDDCNKRGGNPAPNKIAMIHTWTVPNPDGPYAHDNPALPYIATGLKVPETVTKDDRLFGLALGETYGAKLFIAHRIERDLRRQDTAHAGLKSLEQIRVPMRVVVKDLRAAEARGDTKLFNQLRTRLIQEFNRLADRYRELAATPEMRARFDHELQTALDRPHQHM